MSWSLVIDYPIWLDQLWQQTLWKRFGCPMSSKSTDVHGTSGAFSMSMLACICVCMICIVSIMCYCMHLIYSYVTLYIYIYIYIMYLVLVFCRVSILTDKKQHPNMGSSYVLFDQRANPMALPRCTMKNTFCSWQNPLLFDAQIMWDPTALLMK